MSKKMTVKGIEITPDQIDAGLAAMAGEFRASQVTSALGRAGVPYENFIADRTADRLLQGERKAGRIVAITNRLWKSNVR